MTSATTDKTEQAGEKGNVWLALMPPAFVLLWSSGFIAARYGLSHIGPFDFVALRFLTTTFVLLPVVLAWRAPWPKSWKEIGHIAISGLLVNSVAIGGGFFAVSTGMPLALIALIGGLQPLLTGLLAGLFVGEQVSLQQWLGLTLGLAGIFLILWEKLGAGVITAPGLIGASFTVLGMTLGTLYQKRYCANMNLRSGAVIQFLASAVLSGLIALLFETRPVEWTLELVLALLWLGIGLSIGALTLLWLLVRRGAASKVASLFYLVPPVTAVMAWAFFHETLGFLAIAGMAVAGVGVALVTAPRSDQNSMASSRKALAERRIGG